MVSYDANGFYGHPDHIQAHRVAWRAFQLAAGPAAKFYATALPRSVLAGALGRVLAAGLPDGFLAPGTVEDLPYTPDEQVTTEIDGTAYRPAKAAAMAAHATQITVRGDCFALSNGVGQPLLGREFFTLLAGPRGPARTRRRTRLARRRARGPPGPRAGGAPGWEADLLAGLPGASG